MLLEAKADVNMKSNVSEGDSACVLTEVVVSAHRRILGMASIVCVLVKIH